MNDSRVARICSYGFVLAMLGTGWARAEKQNEEQNEEKNPLWKAEGGGGRGRGRERSDEIPWPNYNHYVTYVTHHASRITRQLTSVV